MQSSLGLCQKLIILILSEMSELIVSIMIKEDFSYTEAKELVEEMKDQIRDGAMPEDVLYEYGYDADYVFDLLR
jgi:hypothetical protein